MFCDETKIKVIAGRGGDGCSSFRREKFVPKGGPDGGDGGNGGNIVFKVNPNLNTLSNINSRKIYKAENGDPGKGKNMFGKNGEDLVLEVPEGTIIFNEDKSEQIADLKKEGEEIILARGGKGGLGNARFATSTHQAPRFAEWGEPGEELDLILELKLVADIGIIGLPSAGKSTLISVISNARPKIAAYHFTTLSPNLGVVDMKQFGGSSSESLVVADIPGLIEGASQGKGLGHQFLKHITRTKVLLHLIDASLENPSEDYKTVRFELEKYSKELVKKPEIIAINKVDLLQEDQITKILKKLKKDSKKKEIFEISALTKEGLKPLMFRLLEESEKHKPKEKKKTEELPVLRPHLEKDKFHIDKVKRKPEYKIFHITGKRIEQLMIMTDTSNLEGLERIYQYIEKSGLQRELNRQKAQIGDKLKIGEKKIDYRP